MFGLGYQELLLIVIILALLLFVTPGLFYLLVYVLLWALKSPRLVLIALWFLGVIYGLVTSDVSTAIFAPVGVMLNFAVLWLAGCLWQRIGLSRLGSRWREMASLHFRSLRTTGNETV
jgi:hypothetical protein